PPPPAPRPCMARAPATIPTITSPNASAAAFRWRRITRTPLAESTLVLFQMLNARGESGRRGRFQQESASRQNVATAPGRPCRFLLKRFAIAFLRSHSGLQTTHAYVDRPTRAATAVHVRRHGPPDRPPRPG